MITNYNHKSIILLQFYIYSEQLFSSVIKIVYQNNNRRFLWLLLINHNDSIKHFTTMFLNLIITKGMSK